MSRNSKLVFVTVLTLIITISLIVAFFSSSIANPAESTKLMQEATIPTESPTLTPTFAPTSTPTPTPTSVPSPPLIPVPVDFSCSINNYHEFTVKVNVDLNDGMNQAEAMRVADVIINRALTNATYEVKSVNNNDSLWNVNYKWEYTNFSINGTITLSHFFDVIINPQNQTVTYTRCL